MRIEQGYSSHGSNQNSLPPSEFVQMTKSQGAKQSPHKILWWRGMN